MTATELLEILNGMDENERIEAKRASEVGKSIMETVCAFANEPGLDGGWLLLIVVRDDTKSCPTYDIEGIAQPDKIAADLASQCKSVFNTHWVMDYCSFNLALTLSTQLLTLE